MKLAPYETRTVSRLATILDPRFKKLGFRLKSTADETERALRDRIAHALQKKKKN